MNCKECGYIKDEYEERMSYCDKYFPGYYSEDDITECCYCVKTDGDYVGQVHVISSHQKKSEESVIETLKREEVQKENEIKNIKRE